MKKLLIAAAATATLLPSAAIAGVYNATVATTAVALCRYQLGYNTIEEVTELGENYLSNQGYSEAAISRAMNSPTFNDDVYSAIDMGGGCEKIAR